nr:polysaccharide pyruvyl transferase family protein [Microbacterium sp. MAH-37]
MNEPRKWVVLSSGNGSTNLGDEAMWISAAQAVRQHDPTAAIVTDASKLWLSPIPGVTSHPFFHGALRRGTRLSPELRQKVPLLDSLISFPAKEHEAVKQVHRISTGTSSTPLVDFWAEQIEGSNGLIFSGAGAITKDYAVHGIYAWWALASMAHRAGIPVAFIGQGVGPDIAPKHESYVREMFEMADLITVREAQSAEIVRALSPSSVDPTVTYDWALAIEPTAEERQLASALALENAGGAPFYVLSLHRRSQHARRPVRQLARIADEVVHAAKQRGAAVLFVSNMTAGRYSDDRVTADLITRSMTLGAEPRVVRQRLSPGTTRALLGLSQGTIATRYHPIVFALSEGTPVWGLSSDAYYDQKLSGISTSFGVTHNVSRISDPSISGESIIRNLGEQAPITVEGDILASIRKPLIDFLSKHS